MSDEQAIMFPELDKSPEHKAILKLAKKLYQIRADRKEALTSSKELEDNTQEDLVGKLHDAGMSKFRYENITLEIIPRSEKVKVKVGTDDDEEEEGDADVPAPRRGRTKAMPGDQPLPLTPESQAKRDAEALKRERVNRPANVPGGAQLAV